MMDGRYHVIELLGGCLDGQRRAVQELTQELTTLSPVFPWESPDTDSDDPGIKLSVDVYRITDSRTKNGAVIYRFKQTIGYLNE